MSATDDVGFDLNELGYDSFFWQQFDALDQPDWRPARVSRQDRGSYQLWGEAGEWTGELAGRLRHEAISAAELPAVGDWVAVQPWPGQPRASIMAVLERKSRFSRKAAGDRTDEQVLVANVDTAFLITALDGDFNVRRIERYLTVALASGSAPVVVLNKLDLCEEAAARLADVQRVAGDVEVVAISAAAGDNIDALSPHLRRGRTVALLGSSGVGKSTLINRLSGRGDLPTGPVRLSDSHGRHTTTRREMVMLVGGAILIDTPGLRELALWTDQAGLSGSFAEIDALAEGCRFRDCTHAAEPGCAVRAAIDSGELSGDRFDAFVKLRRELHYLELRQDESAERVERHKWRKIHKGIRKRLREKYGEFGPS